MKKEACKKAEKPAKTGKFGLHWSDRENAILRANYPIHGSAYCAELLKGRNASACRRHARKLHIKRSPEALLADKIGQVERIREARKKPERPPDLPRHQVGRYASVWSFAQGVRV